MQVPSPPQHARTPKEASDEPIQIAGAAAAPLQTKLGSPPLGVASFGQSLLPWQTPVALVMNGVAKPP